MGIVHFVRAEFDDANTCRCPKCEHVSTVKVGDNDTPYVSLFAGAVGPYFVCQNPKCDVERIYAGNAVMTSGK